MDPVTTNSPMDTMGDHFLWPLSANNAEVCWFLAGWDGRDGYEKHCVCARICGHSLCQSVYFGGIGSLLKGDITAAAEHAIFGKFTHVWVKGIAM